MDLVHAHDLLLHVECASFGICASMLPVAWQYCRGRETARFNFKMVLMPKIRFISVYCSQILIIAADCGRSAAIGCNRPQNFGLFPKLILKNRAIRLCSFQCAKMVDLHSNQLRRHQKLFNIGYFHYRTFHYRDFYCIYLPTLVGGAQRLRTDRERGRCTVSNAGDSVTPHFRCSSARRCLPTRRLGQPCDR